MSRIWSVLAALCLALLSTNAWAAVTVPPRPERGVSDTAGVLTVAQKKALEEKVAAFRGRSGPEIGVAIVPSLGDSDLREVGYEIAQEWGIGDEKRKDGVLLLLVVDNAKKAGPGAAKCNCAVIEVGEYLEGTLTDHASVQILKAETLDAATHGDFYKAADGGVQGIIAVVSGDAEGAKAYKDSSDAGGEEEGWFPWWGWVLAVLGALVLQFVFKVPILEILLMFAGNRGGGGSNNGGGFGGGGSFGGGGGKV